MNTEEISPTALLWLSVPLIVIGFLCTIPWQYRMEARKAAKEAERKKNTPP